MPVVTLPLSALLAQALITVTQAYEQRGAGNDDLPTLAVWSNVLRPIGDGTTQKALPDAARLSKRAARAAVSAAEKHGWLVVDTATIRLSDAGEAVRERWPDLDAEVDAELTEELAAALRPLVRQLHLEWPHYPTGYGPADHSITGGVYAAGGGKTDSTIPTHAADWSPVLREDDGGSSVAALSTSALLSQAFVSFAADFEELWLGGLHLAATVLRLLDDDGTEISEIPLLSRLPGNGKSVLERHGFISIERDPATKVRVAIPTARGRTTRDEYDGTTVRVEERWHHKYGSDVVTTLRSTLESLPIDRSLPHSVIDPLV